ncbi:hypothetical protein [Thauera butanivorans]|jgi:hypothetical protein|uniref:hypothetical protein n=1 Tax=Thauera butanivorans TaxID=86174 RepID=UPI000838759C|nr:hypothetical protein [Thauera butanivorans]
MSISIKTSFRDDELIFDDEETRLILKFFWPEQASRINAMVVTNDARRLAQGVLMASIDASHAMGFIAALFKSTAGPSASLQQIARKFVRSALQHHFKHARAKDLEDIQIYESIRREVSRSCRSRFEQVVNGMELSLIPILLHLGTLNSAAA